MRGALRLHVVDASVCSGWVLADSPGSWADLRQVVAFVLSRRQCLARPRPGQGGALLLAGGCSRSAPLTRWGSPSGGRRDGTKAARRPQRFSGQSIPETWPIGERPLDLCRSNCRPASVRPLAGRGCRRRVPRPLPERPGAQRPGGPVGAVLDPLEPNSAATSEVPKARQNTWMRTPGSSGVCDLVCWSRVQRRPVSG